MVRIRVVRVAQLRDYGSVRGTDAAREEVSLVHSDKLGRLISLRPRKSIGRDYFSLMFVQFREVIPVDFGKFLAS